MSVLPKRLNHRSAMIAVVVAFTLAGGFGFSQSAQQKPTLKDFGSSLKRLKWDPINQVAVEITPPDNSSNAAEEDVIRTDTRLVVCDVRVLDKQGRTAAGLTQNDFIVTDDGVAQEIKHFSIGDDAQVERSIVLVIDYSISQFPYVKDSVEAAKHLVDELGPKDRMAIVTDDIKLLADFTANKDVLKGALELLRQNVASGLTGGSAQFSALLATLREMFSGEDMRRIVIFQTDGDELQLLQPPTEAVLKIPNLERQIRPFGLKDIDSAAEKSRVTIYSILPGIRFLGLPEDEQIKRASVHHAQALNSGYQLAAQSPPRFPKASTQFLWFYASRMVVMQSAVSHVAETSGGSTAFLERPDQAAGIYANILSDMNRRYVIGYYPNRHRSDGKRHKVLVQVVNHPEYVVEGRRSYVEPEPKR